MKKVWAVVCMILLLCGCDSREGSMNDAMGLRSAIQESECSFVANITADYGDMVYQFSLECRFDTEGALYFVVRSPETISGIRGSINRNQGSIEFDQTALAFELLADGQLSPISAPWVMMKAIQSGYLQSVGPDGEYSRVTIRDSYEEDAFTVDVWLNDENTPVHGEILWNNRRILTIDVENFQIG